MNLSKEEYKMIQTIAWDLLIDGQICEMPIKITNIAKLYNLEKALDYSKSRWENCNTLSTLILNRYGMNNNGIKNTFY